MQQHLVICVIIIVTLLWHGDTDFVNDHNELSAREISSWNANSLNL